MESSPEDDEDEKIINAREIYVLMHDDYRISRNARSQWFFNNINRTVTCNFKQWQNPEDELQVLCAYGPKDILPEGRGALLYRITPATHVIFVARAYRFVFVLDMSPSISTVDLSSSSVLYEEVFTNLQNALKALVKPYRLPECDILLESKIYVTVIAHTSLINCKNNQVLLQGCLLTQDNLDPILHQLRRDLDLFESNMAACLAEILDMNCFQAEDDQRITFGLFDEQERSDSPDPAVHIMSPEASFVNGLRYGILALQLMPENSTAGLVVITDGVVGIPDHSLFESLMQQLRHTTVSCSFIQLGRGFQLQSGLSHVPYPELLEFIASATMGTFFPCLPEVDSTVDIMNPIQEALLTQSFQKFSTSDTGLGFLSHQLPGYSPSHFHTDKLSSMLHTRKHREKNMHVSISAIIACRLREGYFIKDVSLTKGDKHLEVQLFLPWRNSVHVHYLAASAWPLEGSRRSTHTEVSVEGCYDFLRDMTSHVKQKPIKSSSYRITLMKKFWHSLQTLSETDELLVHMQSFATNALYYKVSDSLKQGIPLFYLPPNQSSPQINTQLSNKDQSLGQFAKFWKPILMLDINIWQKWMHTHRIGFILEHDIPLGKHLHIPNSSGRFHNVSCRQATSALGFFLSKYSTFVLMENHSYVRLLFREADKPPWSFFLIRVASKPPCMVLRVAFVGGTPGRERNEILCALKDELASLRRHPAKDDKGRTMQRRASRADLAQKHIPPLQRPPNEIPCCVLTRKPIEKILIRYERMPRDFSTVNTSHVAEHCGHGLQMSANKMAYNVYTALSRYLFHRRWVWSVQHASSMPISMQAIGRILSNLTKIRLQEGFNVAHTYSGIVNLVLELEMMNPEEEEDEEIAEDTPSTCSCVVQYVIFPPHTTTTKGSVSEDDPEELESAEADGELQVITECWVEPQRGTVVGTTPQASHYQRLSYREIAQTLFPIDADCISTMVTFEHLNLMCQSPSVPSPALLGTSLMPNVMEEDYLTSMSPDLSIQTVPFAFDLLRLLPKCQQVELLFSTYIQEFQHAEVERDRAATLKAGDQERCTSTDGTQNQSPQREAKTSPNEELFSIFLSSLSSVHDREMQLTEVECEQLVGLIHRRDRDNFAHPFPLLSQQSGLITEDDLRGQTQDSKARPIHRSQSVMSMASSMSGDSAANQSQTTFSTVASQSQTGAAFHRLVSTSTTTPVPTRVVSPAPREMDGDSTRACPSESATTCQNNIAMGNITTGSVAKWRCFVRSLTSTHMMLCFVPASFADLLQLVGDVGLQAGQRESSHGPASSKRSSVSGLSHISTPREKTEVPKQDSKKLQTESQSQHSIKLQSQVESQNPESPKTESQSEPTSHDNLENKGQSQVDETEESKTISETQQADIEHTDGTANAEVHSQVDTDAPELADLSNQDEDPEPTAEYFAVRLPIYVYNCPLSLLSEQLVNKWTFKPPADIFEDLTFHGADQLDTGVTCGDDDVLIPSRSRKISDLELGRRDGQPEDVYQSAKELKQHCTMVSETYLRSFVKGLYRGLSLGCWVDSQDVEAAINEICEESLPLEIDLSHFLQYSCGHVRTIIEQHHLEQLRQADIDNTLPRVMARGVDDITRGLSVARAEEEACDDFLHSDALMVGEDTGHTSPPSLLFDLGTLQQDAICESSASFHDLIRERFEEIMQCYFKPVATHPDYYFFIQPSSQLDTHYGDESHELPYTDSQDPDRERHTTISGESIVYEDVCASTRPAGSPEDDQISERASDSTTSAPLGDLDLEAEESSGAETPLFVNLACSVRTGSMLRSIPIKNIPLCFTELRECLAGLEGLVELGTIRVTLDVICLTLPPEEDLADTQHRPCYQRMTSHTSQLSYTSGSAGEDLEGDLTGPDSGLMQRSMGADPLSHLPRQQKESVLACRDQVLWLLKDEITSIMRCIVPVIMETLDMVANHVQSSYDKPMCLMKQVQLKFVGGAEASLTHFIEDFERMKLPGFHLNREGSYYYLSVDKVFDFNQAHAEALHSALCCLDFLPHHLKDGNLSGAKPEADVDGIEVIYPETSLEVITEQRSPAHVQDIGQSILSDGQQDGGTGFHAEDIKISVTRPSPVKELPKNGGFTALPQVKNLEGDTGGYLSDKSTGSSILVLDDKPESEQHEALPKSNLEENTETGEDTGTTDGKVKESQETTADPTRCGTEATSKVGKEEKKAGEEEEKGEKRPETAPEMHIRTRNLSGRSSRHSSGDRPSRHSSGTKSIDGITMTSTPSPNLQRSQSKDDFISSTQQNRRGLSPLTVMGMDVERKAIKRVHSSASIEKYRHEKAKFAGKAGTGRSGWSTPQRRPSDSQTPSRSRHHSGLQTPMSAIETSSRSSVGDDGYDGDSSDLDEEGAMMSFNETQNLRRSAIPPFWLIINIQNDKVSVFFHTRDTGEPCQEVLQYKSLYNQVILKVTDTCRVVNQRMLLEVLYNTRLCDKLLVPEADEEVRWGKDLGQIGTLRNKGDPDSEDSDPEGDIEYFDAARDTDPGHFACPCVWQTSFVLHPRLKTGPGRDGMSRGIQTLRYTVLNKFSVSNRNNMFVYKENATKAVFYMRLEETPGDVVPMTPAEAPRMDDLSASRSSSIWSLNLRRTTEPDDDQITLTPLEKGADGVCTTDKRPTLNRQRSEDIITLSVHGIGQVGLEISKDLVELLQKKLDDAVLKLLTEILARNPMCKLTPEDVQFIQKPNSNPRATIALTIPASAMLQQYALSYYLRQNLQQLVHAPKYMDGGQGAVFMDYTSTPAVPIPDNAVFLYNCSQLSRGNGIACLYLSFVDSKGQPIQLITSPKPLAEAYKDHIDQNNFESLVDTSLYELQKKTPTKTPGAMALVQFRIWAQGTPDLESLTEQLQLTMKHAVADVITEYRLLTAPICEPPQHYYRGMDTPTSSAPPSPGPGRGLDSRHSVSSSDIKKQILDMPEKTPKEKQTFSFQAMMSDIFSKPKDTPKETEEAQPTWQEKEAARRKRQELCEKIQKYETGERGSLLPIYYNTLNSWFSFCHNLRAPGISKQELALSCRFPVENILKDLAAAINAVSQDIIPCTFKQTNTADHATVFQPYAMMRSVSEKEKMANSFDLTALQNRGLNISGANYVMIGRNMKQWRASIDYSNNVEDKTTELPPLTNPKTHKSYQKFKPLETVVEAGDRPEASGVTSLDRSGQAFIPRQRLLIVFINNKKITLLMYNWAAELCSSLERQLIRLVQWHNARSQVLQGILSQKMGLFRHNPLRAPGRGDLANTYAEPNPFNQTYSEFDLVKYTSPPSQPSKSRGTTPAGASTLDDIYISNKPGSLMHKSRYAKLTDPVHRHGAQLLELSNHVKKENEKKLSLQKLYLDWDQRITIPNSQISEELLGLLKRSSRLIHSVATPFMFSPQWSRKILRKQELPKKPDPAEAKQPRSRHSSGASIKSKRSGSIDGRLRGQASVDSPDVSGRSQREEAWHEDLRRTFQHQYSQHLQHLSILPINTRAGTLHRRFNVQQVADDSSSKKSSTTGLKPGHSYLQKTFPGGIMLFEIGFSDVYFLVNIYGFEVSSLPMANINPRLAVMFTDECEKYKDLTHAHSFCHDFHMRTIRSYIHNGPQVSLTRPHYHVTAFLQDFIQQYPYAPIYTLNYVYENCLVIRNTNSPGQQLFEYMLQHDVAYNMKKIKMLSVGEEPETEDFALVSLEDHPAPTSTTPGDQPAKIQPQDYAFALVIAHDQSSDIPDDECTLRLRYWVILVNKRQRFSESRGERRVPHAKIASFSADLASFRCRNRGEQVASHTSVDLASEGWAVAPGDPPPLNHPNYLGYSSTHQRPAHGLVVSEANRARDRILGIVNATITHCRRDLLWQRMLTGEMDEGEGRRKRHKTGDQPEPRPSYMTRLSFHEFREMIGMVKLVDISDIDPQLKALESLPSAWYQGLGRMLTHKYAQSLRTFRSPDGLEQHYVVVNPHHLDMIMMLSIDTLSDQSKMCFVYKDQEVASADTTSHALEMFETFINTCCYHMWTGLT